MLVKYSYNFSCTALGMAPKKHWNCERKMVFAIIPTEMLWNPTIAASVVWLFLSSSFVIIHTVFFTLPSILPYFGTKDLAFYFGTKDLHYNANYKQLWWYLGGFITTPMQNNSLLSHFLPETLSVCKSENSRGFCFLSSVPALWTHIYFAIYHPLVFLTFLIHLSSQEDIVLCNSLFCNQSFSVCHSF